MTASNGDKAASILVAIRDNVNAIPADGALKLNTGYFVKVWLVEVLPTSNWVGRKLTFTIYCGDGMVHLEKLKDVLPVSTVNIVGKEPIEFVEFPFKLGDYLPVKDLIIFYVDTFLRLEDDLSTNYRV